MTYSPIKILFNILLVLLTSVVLNGRAVAACNLTSEQIPRDDVLIVVNDNSISSPQVGDYYCEQRGIEPANVAHVRVPVTNDVQLDQFISLRDQLIKHMQENTLPTGMTPVACDTQIYTRYYCPESMDQLSQNSSIRYVVMTKGLPIRFKFDGSALDGNLEASVDNYLRFWLSDYFSEDVAFSVNFNDRAVDFGDGRGMREINPVIDRELIVGRIDGVDIESAKRLVERALDAEANGIFGKLYGNKFGGDLIRKSLDEGAFWKIWLPDNSTDTIYPIGSNQAGWHYLHGLFGKLEGLDEPTERHTTNSQCASYDIDGIIPKQCVVAVNRGASQNVDDNTIIVEDLSPGNPEGRIPSPDNALVHQGYFDTFSSLIEFDHLLNWRDSASCNTLCADAGDVIACKDASTDVYKEINTQCVRVADGYMGFTFNSYPVGMMASWPTGWFQGTNSHEERFNLTGSAHYYYWQPEVLNVAGVGFDDDFSLWYKNSDNAPSAICFSGSNLEEYQTPDTFCNLEKKISLNQVVDITERNINLADPQEITVRFKYRGIDLNKNVALRARLLLRESETGTIGPDNQVVYSSQLIKTLNKGNDPADGSSWGDAEVTYTLDPALHNHPQYSYDAIKIRIETSVMFEGEFVVDNFSLDIDGEDIPLVNPSFDDGHRQLSGGDSAATFLSRLNGLAFWGNISHHEFNGHSFERNTYETLIYFLRGLPLGDAVWFSEFHNSGIFYGDPIYSPIAIHLDYLSASDGRAPDDHFNIVADSPLTLTGDTLNGSGADITTTYSVDYCIGNDFFPCDQNDSWNTIDNLQNRPGGQGNMSLGDWDISGLDEDDYVLRLAVTSTNSTKGLTQTFYDYYNVIMYSPATNDDFDDDGLSYQEETVAGTNPWSDDTDNDGLPDAWEVGFGLDALIKSTNEDSDEDGVTDAVEFLRGTDPSDNLSVPAITTIEVDPADGIDDGQSPFKTLSAAISSAQAGDEIILLPSDVKHTENFVSFTVPLYLRGSSEKATILKTASFTNTSTVGAVVVSDLDVRSVNTDISINSGTNNSGWVFKRNSFKANVKINSNSSVAIVNVEFVNNVFSGASGDAVNILDGSNVILRNNTLTANNVSLRVSLGSSVKIIDSIIFGNTDPDLIGVQQADISYSLIDDASLAGVNGNINDDPLFVDSLNEDYHLKIDSPAIDAGNPKSDFSQEPPSNICGVNMGAFGNTDEAQTALSFNDAPTGNVNIVGTVSEGSTLTAIIDSICDADGLGSFSYVWRSSGAPVGDNSSTYTLVQSDVTNTLTVTVSYTDGDGTLESFTSTATTQVTPAGDGTQEQSSSSGRIDLLLLLWFSLYGLWRVHNKRK